MAISRAYETAVGTGAEVQVGSNAQRTRRFVIILNDDRNAIDTVIAAPILPAALSQHPSDPLLRATRYRPEQIQNSSRHWIVEVGYTYDVTGAGASGPNVIERWGTIKSVEPIDYDVMTGKPIVNTAGDAYGIAPVREVSDLALYRTATVNEFDPVSLYSYLDSTNASAFRGFSPRMARLVDVQVDTIDLGSGMVQYRVLAVVQFKNRPSPAGIFGEGVDPQRGWDLAIQDTGFNEKVTRVIAGKQVKTRRRIMVDEVEITDAGIETRYKAPSPSAASLKADGSKYTLEELSAGACHVSRFQVYPQMDWSPLAPVIGV
jgi:hypothetical protein